MGRVVVRVEGKGKGCGVVEGREGKECGEWVFF